MLLFEFRQSVGTHIYLSIYLSASVVCRLSSVSVALGSDVYLCCVAVTTCLAYVFQILLGLLAPLEAAGRIKARIAMSSPTQICQLGL